MAEPPGPRARDLGYEPKDVKISWVLTTALIGSIVVVLSVLGVAGLIRLFAAIEVADRPLPPTALERQAPLPPKPRLDPDPAAALATHLEQEAAELAGFGWVDRGAGIAHIPIERAMQLLAERGWPKSESAAGAGEQAQ